MQVFIRYEDEFGNLRDGHASLTVEEEDARPLAADRARLLGEKARRILRDLGLGPDDLAIASSDPPEGAEALRTSSGLVDKAVDFTTGASPRGGETRGLEIWGVMILHAAGVLDLFRAKALVGAITANPTATLPGRALATSLLAEHVRSLLPERLGDSDPRDLAVLEQAKVDFERVVEEFLALEERVPLPDDRLHDDLDVRPGVEGISGGAEQSSPLVDTRRSTYTTVEQSPESWAAERAEVRERLAELEDWQRRVLREE